MRSITSFFQSQIVPAQLQIPFLVLIFLSTIAHSLPAQEFQDPFADPFSEPSKPDLSADLDDPFADPFATTKESTSPEGETKLRGSISFESRGRLVIQGPGGVPDLSIIPTLRLEMSHSPESGESPLLTARDTELRLEGNILGKDSFLARLDLAGDRPYGVISELWFDTPLQYGFHLTAGRIPGTLGLESFPGHERRVSISPGLVDWAGGGSAWGVRTGGRWIKGAVAGDLQFMLEDPVDVAGEKFGGHGILTRFSVRPLSQYLFGGPSDKQQLWKDISLFVSGRWDWEAAGSFRVRSAGDLDLFQTIPLEYDRIHWVRAGWRFPIHPRLQFENEWLRTGFFGVGPTNSDMPGEVTAFQLGLRARLGSVTPLPIALPSDLPGSISQESETSSGAQDDRPIDLLLRYEQLTTGSNLSNLGLLELGSGSNDLESLRLSLTREMRKGFKWTLEGSWTRSDMEISFPSSGDSAKNIFSFRCMLEIGL